MKLKEINKELGTEYKSVKEINWDYISYNFALSESFMETHWEDLNKDWISKYQHLSESFMETHWEDLNKGSISMYQHLSESFMDKHWKDLHKRYISMYQHLSESFMDKHWKDLDKDYISAYQYISWGFRLKHFIKLPKDNWLYKSENFKKKQIKSCKLYECYDDYFIAYKGIRRDRYSKYNFQYQYLPGETYEFHADCSNDENSFGLSVWTEEDAKNYCKQLVVKCKVYYKDVARMVHNNGKIRCFKITILN